MLNTPPSWQAANKVFPSGVPSSASTADGSAISLSFSVLNFFSSATNPYRSAEAKLEETSARHALALYRNSLTRLSYGLNRRRNARKIQRVPLASSVRQS